MACWSDYTNDNEAVGECPLCGEDVDVYGDTILQCWVYSPIACVFCERCPCDGNC